MAIRAAVALRANRGHLHTLLAEHVPARRGDRRRCRRPIWRGWTVPVGRNDPAGVFEQRGRVAFGPGPLFGTGGDGFVGLNFATSPAILKEAVQRMRAAIARLTSHRPPHGLMAAVAGRHGTTRSPNSAVHE